MDSDTSLVGRKLVYESQWLKVYEDQIIRHGEATVYSLVKRRDAAVIVVTTPADDIIMLRNFRYPTGCESLELPAGEIEENEPALDAAIREFREETGFQVATLTPVATYFPLPGLTDQVVHVYCGRSTDVGPSDGRPDSDRDADIASVVQLPATEIAALVGSGRITDGITLCALSLAGFPVQAK